MCLFGVLCVELYCDRKHIYFSYFLRVHIVNEQKMAESHKVCLQKNLLPSSWSGKKNDLEMFDKQRSNCIID